MGTVHSERGLTYYEVVLAGHMVPQFSPVVRITLRLVPVHPADLLYSSVKFAKQASFQIMQYLMGFRDSP